jgi:competence protein ComEC
MSVCKRLSMASRGDLFCLGWLAGVALQLQQAVLWPWQGYAVVVLAAGGLGLRAGRGAMPGRTLLLVTGLLLGLGLTGARATHQAAEQLNPALEGLDTVLTGAVASLPQRGPDGQRFEFDVEAALRDGRAVTVPPRVLLGWYAPANTPAPQPVWRAGERWQLTVRLRRPHGNANPFGFDRERWLWENGLGATGTVRSGPRAPAPVFLGAGRAHPVQSARQAVSERIQHRVAEARSAGVLAALVVGDQSAIDSADWTLFRQTGVAHLMSISGLHVTLFAWLATRWLGALWRRLARGWPSALLACPVPLAAGLGGLALASAYAVFSGWGVPAQRTLLMLGLAVGLRLWARQWPWPSVWLLVMATVLLFDPWAWLQPGFWLSFVAVAILFAADPARQDPAAAALAWPWRAARAFARLFKEQALMTVALAPLSLWLFGQVSLVGLVANLLAIPWVTMLVTPLALLGVLLPPLWSLAAGAVALMARALEGLAAWPWAAVHQAIPPWPLALAGVLGGVLLVQRLPWVLRSAGLLLLWPLLAWTPPRPPPGEFEVLALDVGQGGAVLLRTAGHSLLFDTGPRFDAQSDAGQRVIVPVLRAMGEKLDTVIVSHRDSDHAGGSAAVRAAWPQARWLSSFEPGERCLAGQRWHWDGVEFELLHPGPGHYGPGGEGLLSSNAMSCVLRVHNARRSAWLSGDLDAAQETRLALARPELRADLLLAPHHGSHSSSSPVLLNRLMPSRVLIQSGYRNRFGHPAPLVLQRYRERGMVWVNSPDCGAATWRSLDPQTLHCERQRDPRYWRFGAGAPN